MIRKIYSLIIIFVFALTGLIIFDYYWPYISEYLGVKNRNSPPSLYDSVICNKKQVKKPLIHKETVTKLKKSAAKSATLFQPRFCLRGINIFYQHNLALQNLLSVMKHSAFTYGNLLILFKDK